MAWPFIVFFPSLNMWFSIAWCQPEYTHSLFDYKHEISEGLKKNIFWTICLNLDHILDPI